MKENGTSGINDMITEKMVSIHMYLVAGVCAAFGLINIISGGTVYPKVMEKHLREELPLIASENILMDAVSRGGDRQELHEIIRRYSREAAAHVKLEGRDNNLLELLMADERFGLTEERIKEVLDLRKFVGCAPEQTEDFVRTYAKPVLEKNKELLGVAAEIKV